MAGYDVPVLVATKFRNDSRANVDLVAAAWMEGATSGRIHRAGDVTLQNDLVHLMIGICHGYGRKERLCVRVTRVCIEFD